MSFCVIKICHHSDNMRQARERLGYVPSHSLVQGLMETLPGLPGPGSSSTTTAAPQARQVQGPTAAPTSALEQALTREAPGIGRLLTRQPLGPLHPPHRSHTPWSFG